MCEHICNLTKINGFQEKCINKVHSVLGQNRMSCLQFVCEKGSVGIYYFASLTCANKTTELYLYDDEAAIHVGKKYRVCEVWDYDGEDELILDFGRRLQLTIDTGRPY